jgi:hypothetical protein
MLSVAEASLLLIYTQEGDASATLSMTDSTNNQK